MMTRVLRHGLVSLAAATWLVLTAAQSFAEPTPRSDPHLCASAFECGALGASLWGKYHDRRGALVAEERACRMDPEQFCDDYAKSLIDAGRANGGDPQRGIAVLIAQCKDGAGNEFACTALERTYDNPITESGLPRRPRDAERLLSIECDAGRSLSCSSLSRFYAKGCAFAGRCPQGSAIDDAKARASLEKACASKDTYAPGTCAELGDALSRGSLGVTDRARAEALLAESCKSGYRCDRAVDLAIEDHDVPRAESIASGACARRPITIYCEELSKLEPLDRPFVVREYTRLCATSRSASIRELACNSLVRLGAQASAPSAPTRATAASRAVDPGY